MAKSLKLKTMTQRQIIENIDDKRWKDGYEEGIEEMRRVLHPLIMALGERVEKNLNDWGVHTVEEAKKALKDKVGVPVVSEEDFNAFIKFQEYKQSQDDR